MKLLIPILLAVLAATVRPAGACDCEPPSVHDAYWAADLVFTGKVTSVTGDRATVAIDTRFRGAITGTTITLTNGKMCDYTLLKGATYFIYAKRSGAIVRTGLCGGTRPLAEAAADLAFARKPVK